MFDAKMNDEGEVVLSGRLDASQTDKLKLVLESLDSSCVINFEGLEYISSVGLGIFIATHQRLSKSGGELKLVKMNKHVRDIFGYCGFDRIFKIE